MRLRCWPFSRKSMGDRGEDVAVRYLKKQGYKIRARNVVTGRYELDIVCQDKDTVVFVEVRSRSEADAVPPEDSIGPTKQRHVRNAAHGYMHQHYAPETYYRIDVVAVTFGAGGHADVTHIPDAFH